MRKPFRPFALLSLPLLITTMNAQQPSSPQPPQPKPEETEVWEPVPRVVTPGATDAAPPSDAIVLFDGKDLHEWVTVADKSPADWIVAEGLLTVNKLAGHNIETRRSFR